jgi:hypothetical protein
MTKLVFTLVVIALLSGCASEKEKDILSITTMESPADSVSLAPYLFTDKNEQVYLSWISRQTGKSTLQYSVLRADGWSPAQAIASGSNWFVNWADYPVLAGDGASSMIAHYLEKSENGKYTYDIKLRVSADSGKSWSEPILLHDDGKKAEHGFVSMAAFEENYFVAWLDGRNAVMEENENGHEGHQGQMTVRGAIVDKSGKKVQEWVLDNKVCDCCQTSTVITANGPVVIYRDRSDTEIRDMSIVRLVNGEWTKPQSIYADNWKIEGCPVNGPRIAALGNNMAIAWFSSPNENSQVKLVFSNDGGASFSEPVQVNKEKAIGRVDIEMIDESTAWVSWMEGSKIKAARVNRKGKIEKSIDIATTSESRPSGFPQMTRSGNRLIFAWTDAQEKKIKLASLPMGG